MECSEISQTWSSYINVKLQFHNLIQKLLEKYSRDTQLGSIRPIKEKHVVIPGKIFASWIWPSQQSCSSKLWGLLWQHPCPAKSIMCSPQHPWYNFVNTTGLSLFVTLQHPLVSRSYGDVPQQAFGWNLRSGGFTPGWRKPKLNI